MSQHVLSLIRTSFYQCPDVSAVNPFIIDENQELVEIITGGKVRFDINGEETVFTRGSVFWHRSGEPTVCKTFPESPYRCFAFLFQVQEGQRPGPRVSVWADPEEAVSFAAECHRAFHSVSTDRDALSHYAYSMIRWKAFANCMKHPPQCPQILLDACDYMEHHMSHNLTTDIIAAKVGISRPYLFALFKKHFQKAPLHYLQELRISRAKALLTATGEGTIKEIAATCGFNELEVFYRQFKKQVGQSPGAYRQKNSINRSL